MSDDGRGAPKGNTNAEKHGLWSDREKLRDRLDPEEERFLVQMSKDLLEKFPEDAQIGAYERMSVRNIALDTLKRERANEFIVTEDLDQEASKRSERASKQYNRIMNASIKEMEKMGLITESPDAKSADAAQQQANWMERINEASASDE